jgi:hypothetical protein
MESEPSSAIGRRRRASEGNKRANQATKENSPQKNEAIQRISSQLLSSFEQNFQWDREQRLVIKKQESALSVAELNEQENRALLQNERGTRESVTNFVEMIAEQSGEEESDMPTDPYAPATRTARKSRKLEANESYNYFSNDKNLVKQIECFRKSLLKEPLTPLEEPRACMKL